MRIEFLIPAHLTEWIAAWSAFASAVFIGLTVLVARNQLTALNKATQLQTFIPLVQEFDSDTFSKAYGFVWSLRGMPFGEKRQCIDSDSHNDSPQFDMVMNYMERIALLANHGFLNHELAIMWWGKTAEDVYQTTKDFIQFKQQSDHDSGFCSELSKFVVSVSEYHRKHGPSSTTGGRISNP